MPLKDKIIEFRTHGYSYNKIQTQLKCSKGVISYHCNRAGMAEIGLSHKRFDVSMIDEISSYYLSHTKEETMEKFNVSSATISKYIKKKRVFLTDEDRRLKNYQRLKRARVRIKEKAILYKGGKCIRCGYDKCTWALSFHHRDAREKEFNISQYKVMKWGRIKAELDKIGRAHV